MNNKPLIHVTIGFVLLLTLLVARLFQLQIVEADEWQRQARSSRLDKNTIPFKRGQIVSANGALLAEDYSVYDLYFRYRDFRRHHPIGQLHAALSLLGATPPHLADCLDNAEQLSQSLLALRPQQLLALPSRDRDDLSFYLSGLFGLDSKEQRDLYKRWLVSGESMLGESFSEASIYFASRVQFSSVRFQRIESLLGPEWQNKLLVKIEQRRAQLQLMVFQRALQTAAARALNLAASELRNQLLSNSSRLNAAHLLHQHWKLDGRAEYLAAMLSPADDHPSEQLRQQELSQKIALFDQLYKQISLASPEDTAGIWRDQQYRVHRFRVVSFENSIDYSLIDLLAQHGDEYPGLYLQKNTRRNYPVELNPQILGMVRLPQEGDLLEYRALNDRFHELRKMFYRNADDEAEYRQLRHRLWSATLRPDETRGISGIESVFEEVLRGVRGYLQVLEGGESGRAPLELLYSSPQNGHDIKLSLDTDLIEMAEQSIARVYRQTKQRMRSLFPNVELSAGFDSRTPKVGFALIDLKNERLPLLATSPTIGREQLRSQYQELAGLKSASPLRHRALAGNYWPQETPYPGSTFKPLVAAAALMFDPSLYDKKYHCAGTFQATPGGALLRCDTRYGHQEISMRDALKKSCNIYFYKLAREIGANEIHNLASALEFGRNTGIEIAALEKGANYLVDVESMQSNTMRLMRTAIGQVGVQASPLQMARFYGWLATSTLPDARIVIEGAGAAPAVGQAVEVVFSNEQRGLIVDALSAVSYELGGTAFKTDFPSAWQVVAKTGTSQVSAGGVMQPTHAWFTGYFPADDPQFSFAIMCENTGLHGGQIASFILKDFLQNALPLLAPELVEKTHVR